MIRTIIHDVVNKPTAQQKKSVINFLYIHLEQYGDKREDIQKCLDYALKKSKGGFIVTAFLEDEMVAAAVINHTGMEGYIPENILVYIATHSQHRGKGIASALMDAIMENTQGDLALHVEHDNPAIGLYKKYGFTNKYLEMRLNKSSLLEKKEELHGAYNA